MPAVERRESPSRSRVVAAFRESRNTFRRANFRAADTQKFSGPTVRICLPMAHSETAEFLLRAIQSFSDNFDQNALSPFAVEFAIKDFFPGTKIQFSFGDSYHNLTTHDSTFKMGIGIILRAVVLVLRVRFFRCELFQPALKIVMEP